VISKRAPLPVVPFPIDAPSTELDKSISPKVADRFLSMAGFRPIPDNHTVSI